MFYAYPMRMQKLIYVDKIIFVFQKQKQKKPTKKTLDDVNKRYTVIVF